MRERPIHMRLAIQLLGTVVIALVVATIGPFGTFTELSPADRYLYWAIIIPLNWLQILAAITLVASIPQSVRWPRGVVVSAGCVIASVPASFEVHWLEQWLKPDGVYAITPFQLFPYVLLLSLVIALPLQKFLWRRRETGEAMATSQTPTVGTPTFLKSIPRHLGTDLLCVQAEDHYLRVHTSVGSDMILYRMADALAGLEGADGLQVHRSYWVAGKAVASAAQDGKRVSLKLENGLVVPVSRTYLPAVRKAGWLT